VPWELGLAEAQQVLVRTGLRARVRLRVDGGLKVGRDVIVAACLGADEFGFGSAAVVALGCVMARQCHLNTCPAGIATQREDLRRRFSGTPEMVAAYLRGVAEDVRRQLAELGARSLEEVIGRVDLLRPRPVDHRRARTVDLSFILTDPDPAKDRPRRAGAAPALRPEARLDHQILADISTALEQGRPVDLTYPITTADRAVGARLAGVLAQRYGDEGVAPGTITLRFRGSAGQSFGAFLVPGVTLCLEGEANDYVGKGMAGGEIVIRPPAGFAAPTERSVIAGEHGPLRRHRRPAVRRRAGGGTLCGPQQRGGGRGGGGRGPRLRVHDRRGRGGPGRRRPQLRRGDDRRGGLRAGRERIPALSLQPGARGLHPAGRP
jgi:hypothetical protein